MQFDNDSEDSQGGKGTAERRPAVAVPLLPLRDMVVFPYMVVPLFVGRDKSIAALEEAMVRSKEVFLSAQRRAKTNEPGPGDIYRIGTLSSIIQLLRLPDGTVKVLVEGKRRARLVSYTAEERFFLVEVQEVVDKASPGVELEALARSIRS
ncbi:MAG: endopeptidase La, partial [Deltaproteobacteria bacterium]|nr:endopeptidase La [Deltaproteobacteria bacterium]